MQVMGDLFLVLAHHKGGVGLVWVFSKYGAVVLPVGYRLLRGLFEGRGQEAFGPQHSPSAFHLQADVLHILPGRVVCYFGEREAEQLFRVYRLFAIEARQEMSESGSAFFIREEKLVALGKEQFGCAAGLHHPLGVCVAPDARLPVLPHHYQVSLLAAGSHVEIAGCTLPVFWRVGAGVGAAGEVLLEGQDGQGQE